MLKYFKSIDELEGQLKPATQTTYTIIKQDKDDETKSTTYKFRVDAVIVEVEVVPTNEPNFSNVKRTKLPINNLGLTKPTQNRILENASKIYFETLNKKNGK